MQKWKSWYLSLSSSGLHTDSLKRTALPPKPHNFLSFQQLGLSHRYSVLQKNGALPEELVKPCFFCRKCSQSLLWLWLFSLVLDRANIETWNFAQFFHHGQIRPIVFPRPKKRPFGTKRTTSSSAWNLNRFSDPKKCWKLDEFLDASSMPEGHRASWLVSWWVANFVETVSFVRFFVVYHLSATDIYHYIIIYRLCHYHLHHHHHDHHDHHHHHHHHHHPRQFIETKPPRSPQKVVNTKGILPKMSESF